ncbi:MAG: monofunctional biosynthetic peptidoglycan transglycosylase [Nevskiaceae bacterium]
MNSPRPRIAPSLTPRDEPIDVLLRGEPAPEFRPSRRGALKRFVLWALLVLTILFFVPPGVVLALRWVDPPTTAFMLRSKVQPVEYHWVPASQIPESMRIGVITAEDQKFWTHWGFDFIAIAEALEHNEKNTKKRGASTITQQTAKNLFLWPSRSWLRKGLEVTFTLLLELELPKERILEIYLNIAEFGPGVYGVDAASRKFFGRPAAEMNPEQTARLVAVLPNPRKWSAKSPGPYVQQRIDWVLVNTGQPPRFSALPVTEEPVEGGGGAPEPPADELPVEEGMPEDSATSPPVEGTDGALEPDQSAPGTEPAPTDTAPSGPAPSQPDPQAPAEPAPEPAPPPPGQT